MAVFKLCEVHDSTCAYFRFLAERKFVPPPEGLRGVEVKGWGPSVCRRDLRKYCGVGDESFERLVSIPGFSKARSVPWDVPGGSFSFLTAEWAFVTVLLPSFEGPGWAPEVV